jgi:uncharacterized protein YjdB
MTIKQILAGCILIFGAAAVGACNSVKTLNLMPPQVTLNQKDATAIIRADAKDDKGVTVEKATVTWTSSASEVASVDDGKVTALKSGEATITATCGQATSTTKVTVAIPATLELSPAKVDMTGIGVGSAIEAHAKDETGKEITRVPLAWKSSDDKVVRVTNGRLLSQSVGTATITATVGTITAQATVNVKMPEFARIQVEPTKNVLETAGASMMLKAAAVDAKGTTVVGVPIQWISSDDKVATVSANGLVTAVKKGRVKVTAKSGDKMAVADISIKK